MVKPGQTTKIKVLMAVPYANQLIFLLLHCYNIRNGCMPKISKPRTEWHRLSKTYFKTITDWPHCRES